MMTDLKKLAEEITAKLDQWMDKHGGYYGESPTEEKRLELTMQALERVQKEGLEARIVWPSETEVDEAYRKYCVSGWPFKESVTERFYFWLHENIRLAPVEEVSDEELRKLAVDNCAKHMSEYIVGWDIKQIKAFEVGYRAAEKKARGE